MDLSDRGTRSYVIDTRRIGKKLFPCPQCTSSFGQKQSLTRHLKYECLQEPRFACPYCDHRSKKTSGIYGHVRRRHVTMKVYAIDIYGKKRSGSHQRHFAKFGKAKLDDSHFNSYTGKFHCPKCNSGYGRRDTMLGHYRYECNQPPRYKCPYCQLLSKKTSNVYQHVRAVHPSETVTLVKLY
ncbi:zinc finger protein 271-like [Leptopilina boulardi]|uniref:zinc finger protein 271-like n=1 Tax=Leptopilina boulardi TaxID=63433 RepID=UPI0021F62480|nr:zinc finger protein 271-like [Leptopilina boulardi]